VAGVGAGLFVGDARRHVVEPEIVAHLPGDVVIGAGRVTTHTKAAHERPVSVVQRETAAEHVGAPDPLPYHEVFRGAVVGRVAAISGSKPAIRLRFRSTVGGPLTLLSLHAATSAHAVIPR